MPVWMIASRLVALSMAVVAAAALFVRGSRCGSLSPHWRFPLNPSSSFFYFNQRPQAILLLISSVRANPLPALLK